MNEQLTNETAFSAEAQASLPQFAADGKRLLDDKGLPTKAGFRELRVRLIVSRGADEATARRLAEMKIVKSKRNSWANETGGTCYALTLHECKLLGKTPGPANF